MAAGAPRPLFAEPPGFREWLPREFGFKVLVESHGGGWYAIAEDFDVTGMGVTPREAVADVIELVAAYLRAHFEEGSAYEDALRPVSLDLRTRLESKLGNILSSFSRTLTDRVGVPREERVDASGDGCAVAA